MTGFPNSKSVAGIVPPPAPDFAFRGWVGGQGRKGGKEEGRRGGSARSCILLFEGFSDTVFHAQPQSRQEFPQTVFVLCVFLCLFPLFCSFFIQPVGCTLPSQDWLGQAMIRYALLCFGLVYGHKSREPLPMDQVKGARQTRIRFMTAHGMFEIVPESEVRGKTVSAAWQDHFGKAGVSNMLVGSEFDTYQRDDVILDTPPLSVARLLVSNGSGVWNA